MLTATSSHRCLPARRCSRHSALAQSPKAQTTSSGGRVLAWPTNGSKIFEMFVDLPPEVHPGPAVLVWNHRCEPNPVSGGEQGHRNPALKECLPAHRGTIAIRLDSWFDRTCVGFRVAGAEKDRNRRDLGGV